jgi:hypothetical protein
MAEAITHSRSLEQSTAKQTLLPFVAEDFMEILERIRLHREMLSRFKEQGR